MSLGNSARAAWRRIKEPVLEGRGTPVQRFLYRALSGFVSRHKGALAADDLPARALWLMYHPEAGVLPCDGWRMDDPPRIASAELAELRARRAADAASVAARLNLFETPLAAARADAAHGRRIAVHIHAYFPELLPQILAALDAAAIPCDLFVSVPEGARAPEVLAGHPRCTVRACPNRGRDIAPLVCLFGKDLASYDYVAHFHTKKSPHVKDRPDWLAHELRHLLGGADAVRRVFGLLADGCGMVAAPDVLGMAEDPTGWLHNLPLAEDLARRGGLAVDLRGHFTPIAFPQGSMFWARGEFLARLFALPLTFGDFPAEPIGADGSPAHALERLFFLWGLGTGLRVARLAEGGCA